MIVLIKVVCIVLAIAIIALVLLQQGKGSDLGSAFGGGSSNSMFGALGPSDFLGKLTYGLVATWLVLTMAFRGGRHRKALHTRRKGSAEHQR